MHAGTAAAAAAGTSGAGGLWLFSYNKENFQYDAGMRFGRFTMSRTFANAQVGQYREDIHGICETTITKMDAWQTVTVCFLQVCAALSCAGRIGMHGAAPSGWLCSLFVGCTFMATLFCGISLWLSMHASLRAQCAATSLLTRKVRLPIPSMAQLDQARVFASSYEKQEARDIFRVPFWRHPHDTPDMPPVEEAGASSGKRSKKNKKKDHDPHGIHDPHQEFASTARDTVPSWIRDEAVMDKGNGKTSDGEAMHELSDAPTHFKLLMQAQEEWRDYDVYARISMLYGIVSFLYATAYYCIGTCIAELRGFWVMWSLPLVFMTAQALILRLDILRTGTHMLPNAEFLGHLAPYFAVGAASLDYRFFYSERTVAITWGLVMMCFFAHLVMALRMLDLAYPEASVTGEMPEEPGKQWWPASWKVPAAFRKNLWFITPPKKLEPDQHCLMHEMEDMANHGGGVAGSETCRRRKRATARAKTAGTASVKEDSAGSGDQANRERKRRNDLPWQIVRVGCLTSAVSWAGGMAFTAFEVIMGPESLLKPPGEPPWIRDTKYRHYNAAMMHSSNSQGLPDDYRLFSASQAYYEDEVDHNGEDHSEGGHSETGEASNQHRRLKSDNKSARSAVLGELLKTLPLLEELAGKVSTQEMYVAAGDGAPHAPTSATTPAGFMAVGPKSLDVAWPPLFEPKHVLCGYQAGVPGKVLALTRRGFGALVPVDQSEEKSEAQPFSLDGIGEMGPLAGATWTRRGLQLVTTAGKFLHCPGSSPVLGSWSCKAAQHTTLTLPAGSELLAAAFKEAADDAKDASAAPLLALVLNNFPKLVVLYADNGHSWSPSGEVHLPHDVDHRIGLNFHGDDLLVTTSAGEVHRHSMGGAPPTVHTAPTALVGRHFTSVCPTSEAGLARLGMRHMVSDVGTVRGPELLFSD